MRHSFPYSEVGRSGRGSLQAGCLSRPLPRSPADCERGACVCGVFGTADVHEECAGRYFAGPALADAVKRDFGTMQWMPLRTSTTWLTRQSAAIAASEYAS